MLIITINLYLPLKNSQRFLSDRENSAMVHHVRCLAVPPSSHDNSYSNDNSLKEVDATLNNLDDEIDDTRRRVEGACARLREALAISNPAPAPPRPTSGDNGDSASIRSGRTGVFPPGFDMTELTNYV